MVWLYQVSYVKANLVRPDTGLRPPGQVVGGAPWNIVGPYPGVQEDLHRAQLKHWNHDWGCKRTVSEISMRLWLQPKHVMKVGGKAQ